MVRPFLLPVILFLLSLSSWAPGNSAAQMIDTIGSEHIRLRMPAERGSLGRDLAAEIERCYVFMNRATGQSLPRKILIMLDWDQSDSVCNLQNAAITIGMNHPEASADVKGFLMHSAAKEIARLGLLALSGGAQREDTEFLFEGMTEILAHEYAQTTRGLEGAWIISRYLDEMKLLGVAIQRSWTDFSSGRRCLRSAAPGVTLLTTYRELQGRETPLRLFEALKKKSLTASLAAAFRAPAAEVENVWLQRVRQYTPVDEITVTAEDAPQLLQTNHIPGTVSPGLTLELQMFFRDRMDNLMADGVFVRDERTGRMLQAEAPARGAGYFVVKIPVEGGSAPGDYRYEVTAIDEAGNLRRWTGTYKISLQSPVASKNTFRDTGNACWRLATAFCSHSPAQWHP